MKKFAKKGKGQYGLALWAKFVGRYYLYQVILSLLPLMAPVVYSNFTVK
jgi:hypothetical protein